MIEFEDDRGALVLGIGDDEAAVHLQRVEGQLAQARQRGIAGAEVVAGEADAQFAEAFENLRGAFRILHDEGFGHLDLEAAAHAGLRG